MENLASRRIEDCHRQGHHRIKGCSFVLKNNQFYCDYTLYGIMFDYILTYLNLAQLIKILT